jgi:hypothetical protein
MSGPSHPSDELRTLLYGLCDETITTEQVRRLEELVLTHPEAEAYYVQFMRMHSDLIHRFGALPARTEQSLRDRASAAMPLANSSQNQKDTSGSARRRVLRGSRLVLWGAMGLSGLAAGILLALTFWPQPQRTAKTTGPIPEAEDNSVAVLLQAPGAEWEETGMPRRVGAALPAGILRLKAGFAHIEFYSGAVVILEGPAEFQLISRTQSHCTRGKLRAMVPPQAQGFTIGSPSLNLVDRGTDFGLQVGEGGKTEVHVFQGKVEVIDSNTTKNDRLKSLTTGQALRVEGPGIVRPIKTAPAEFQNAQGLATLANKETVRRQTDWLAASEALRRDPSLVLYYTFQAENSWSRALSDQTRGRQQPRDGAVVGCSWVTGRWPGKQGLEFKRVSDRVRLHVPGEFESLSLLAWVRIDALPNLNNSLLMADGWSEGSVHWQIGDQGKLILGIQSRPKGKGAHYHALEAITAERFGQWTHLAVVYDKRVGLVTHYVDGVPAAQVPIEFDIPLKIGDAELGNWNIATHRNPSPVRFFSGCMDEFMLFSRALGDEDVKQLYEQGKPPT